MNEARVRALMDAYGADPARWPADEREAALAMCADSVELQAYQRHANVLDQQLDTHQVVTSATVAELLDRIADDAVSMHESAEPSNLGVWEQMADWLFPTRIADVWRPALAASMPVLAGLYIGAAGLLVPIDDDWAESEQFFFSAYVSAEDGWEAEQ